MVPGMNSSLRPLVLILLAGFVSSAHAATKLIAKVPFTISVPWQYAFAKNLSYTGIGNAITINTDDVSIDLRGFTLQGKTVNAIANDTRGIFADGKNHLTIRNGTIRGFARGVIVDGIDTNFGDLVEDLTVLESTYIGIQVGGSDSIVRRNRVRGVGGATFVTESYGLYLRCPRSVITENLVTDLLTGPTTRYGIYFDVSHAVVVERNRVLNTNELYSAFSAFGYYFSLSTFPALDGNVSSQFATGFHFENCLSVYYRDNTATRVVSGYVSGGNSILNDAGGNK
jgi:hypothetical protein